MARSIYKGFDTYVIYAEDSAFGTPGTPSGSSTFGKVTNFTYTMTNNLIRSQGIGEGRNATQVRLGNLEIKGSMDFEVDNFSIFQYAIGEVSGAGAIADPYQVDEMDNIGYASGFTPTLTVEVGSEGGTNDDVVQLDGVAFESLRIRAEIGQAVTGSMAFVARKATSSTTLETYTPNADGPFVPISGNVTVGSDSGKVVSYEMNVTTGLTWFWEFDSRLIAQPLTGQRRYDFTLVMKKDYNDTASTLSAIEARGRVLNGATNGTTNIDAAEIPSAGTVSLDLTEGAASGDRVVNIDLETCYFESWDETVGLDGEIEVTIGGFGLAGLTDGADNVPIRWYAIA